MDGPLGHTGPGVSEALGQGQMSQISQPALVRVKLKGFQRLRDSVWKILSL